MIIGTVGKKIPLVGIVIPFYDGLDYLDKLTSSIYDSIMDGYFNVEILLVDNSPTNYKDEINKRFPSVKYARPGINIGYGKASNEGYRYFKERVFDYVIVSNQDGYFHKNLIESLISPFIKDESILLTAPLLYTYDDNQVESFFIEYYLKFVPEFISDLLLKKDISDYYITKDISGACFAIKLDNKLFELNLFDPNFHMYYEDVDLCNNILKAGKKIALVTKATFYHHHSHTTDMRNSTRITKWKAASEMYYRFKQAKSYAKISAIYGIFLDQFFNSLRLFFKFRFRDVWRSFQSFFLFLKVIIFN